MVFTGIVIYCRDKVVDFHWNASDPWTIVSVSDDCESTGGGGTLQVTTNCVLIGHITRNLPFNHLAGQIHKLKKKKLFNS